MITGIVWGLVTGTETSLDGLILKFAKYYDDKDWHLIGSKPKDEEKVIEFFHDTTCKDWPMEEFGEIWDNGEFETPGGGTAIINPINVEVLEVLYERNDSELTRE